MLYIWKYSFYYWGMKFSYIVQLYKQPVTILNSICSHLFNWGFGTFKLILRRFTVAFMLPLRQRHSSGPFDALEDSRGSNTLTLVNLYMSACIVNCTRGLKGGTEHFTHIFLFLRIYLYHCLPSSYSVSWAIITHNPLCPLLAVYFRSVGLVAPPQLCVSVFQPLYVFMGEWAV